MRHLLDRRVPVAKVAIGTLLALTLAAAAAYAAAGHGGRGKEPHAPAGKGHKPGGKRHDPAESTTPPAPVPGGGSGPLRIVGHPPAITTATVARFRVEAPGRPTLRCRLDRRPAQDCDESALVYRAVGVGQHTFYAASVRRGRTLARASYSWLTLEPQPFTVTPQPEAVGPLYPGAPPSPIPVTVGNPNPVPITVTSLRITASGGGAACPPAENVALTAPDLSGGGLRIGAHASVALPSPTVAAPTIGLRELPVPQDGCKNVSFELSFSGSAGG